MIHIITGSTLGGAEYVGDHLNDLLTQHQIETQIHNQPDITTIPASDIWLIITSTHGAGDFPDNIQTFMSDLKNTPPNMSQVKFAVIGIGDSSYDTFCGAGKAARELLLDIGATEICRYLEIDVLSHPIPETLAEEWLKDNLTQFTYYLS